MFRNAVIQSDLLQRAQYGGDAAVRQRAEDLEIIVFARQWITGEPSTHNVDQVIWKVGKIHHCFVLDLPIFAVSVPQQVGDIGLPPKFPDDQPERGAKKATIRIPG